MSCNVVSDRHIDHVVTAIIQAELMAATPDEIGRALWRENLASVAYHYPDDKDGERPGPIDFRDADVDTYTWQETAPLTAAELNATLAGYEYQSCEHPEWDDSPLRAVVAKLRDPIRNLEFPDGPSWDWPSRAWEAQVQAEQEVEAEL
jgi:hypothetical protein